MSICNVTFVKYNFLVGIALAYGRYKSCITLERENADWHIGYAFVTDNMHLFFVTALRHLYVSVAYDSCYHAFFFLLVYVDVNIFKNIT